MGREGHVVRKMTSFELSIFNFSDCANILWLSFHHAQAFDRSLMTIASKLTTVSAYQLLQ